MGKQRGARRQHRNATVDPGTAANPSRIHADDVEPGAKRVREDPIGAYDIGGRSITRSAGVEKQRSDAPARIVGRAPRHRHRDLLPARLRPVDGNMQQPTLRTW